MTWLFRGCRSALWLPGRVAGAFCEVGVGEVWPGSGGHTADLRCSGAFIQRGAVAINGLKKGDGSDLITLENILDRASTRSERPRLDCEGRHGVPNYQWGASFFLMTNFYYIFMSLFGSGIISPNV